ncbi:hypothetical protein TAMA11512_08670 [Selenomonas sp. TAMA-11512]|uniref:hypothetical protein n=1 Tax=Selenomonas sp. TAMA-11512 TaxID=3095337 RepID=UPI00308A0284|nr:hypothetical protein TAMA11512_08670 [Selenomonas sp. TAMA-11512]
MTENSSNAQVLALMAQDTAGGDYMPIVTHGGGGLGDAIQTLHAHTDTDVANGLAVPCTAAMFRLPAALSPTI